MEWALLVAGLPQIVYDRFQKESSKRFVPSGRLIAKPLTKAPTYTSATPVPFLRDAAEYAMSLPERTPFGVLLLFVDYGDAASSRFAEEFFPFSLSSSLRPFELRQEANTNTVNRALNEYIKLIADAAGRLTKSANAVRAALQGNNLTPLLLPVVNFSSSRLKPILKKIFSDLVRSADAENSLKAAQKEILRFHPWVSQTLAPRCLSDGILYFKSPGSHKHGFFRNQSMLNHDPPCLLKARSRLGGPCHFNFHYDCTPVKGSLKSHYANCHGELTPPHERHVNICPNDFIF